MRSEPCTRPRGRFLRHPVLCGLAGAFFSGGLCAVAIERVDYQVALCTPVTGMFWFLLVIAERKRLDHYGHPWRKARDDVSA